MSWLVNAFRNFAALWGEGLVAAGTYALLEHERPIDGNTESEADREAWEEERARLALSPWWM